MKRILVISILGLAAAVMIVLIVGAPAASPRAATGEPVPVQDEVADGVVAFYFHGNARCRTCRTIEAYADEAMHSGFGKAIEDGALAWRVVNVEGPANRHFIKDFQLVTKSVVLAEYHDGGIIRWKNLDKVWKLVRSKGDFVQYVQGEARDFLEAS